jgi:ssDNA-binding replication factor A large subunit
VQVEKVKVADIKGKMSGIDVRVRLVSKGEPKFVKSRAGRPLKLSEVLVGDDSDTIVFTLWGDTADTIEVNDVLDIKNAYASEWMGHVKLTLGKQGTMEQVEDPDFPPIREIVKEED